MSLRANVRAALACGLLLLIFAETGWLAWLNKSATFDEPGDLFAAWVQTHELDFRCMPEDPPLYKYYAVAGTPPGQLRLDRASPIWGRMSTDMNATAPLAHDALYVNPVTDPDVLLRHARARMIGLGIVLGVLIAWWAWRLAGPLAGIVAAAAFCFDPNFLANAPLVKDDVAMALCFVALMAAIWLAGERATLWRCLGIGVMLGIAVTTKFSGLLALGIVPLALMMRALLATPWEVMQLTARTRPQRMLAAIGIYIAALMIGYLILWAAYLFRYSPTNDPRQDFDLSVAVDAVARRQSILAHGAPMIVDPPQIQQWMRSWHPDFLVRLATWGDAHRLLPQAWTYGLLGAYSASHIRLAFLCGQSSFAGWWYYFPLAMLFKTPLATLIALGLGVFVWFCGKAPARLTNPWPLCVALIAPLLYMAMSLRSHLNIGLRHVLPVYPFLFIFIGVAAARARRRWPGPASWIIGAFIVGLALETICAFPDFIPFFNVAAGGSRGGLRLLSDSNIDWGQELLDLALWQQRHPDRLIYLGYFGTADPHYYGIRYIELSQSQTVGGQPPGAAPPVYAISAVLLQIPYPNKSSRDFCAGLLRQTPIAVLGGSLYLYDAR